jgi:hypothetical protein
VVLQLPPKKHKSAPLKVHWNSLDIVFKVCKLCSKVYYLREQSVTLNYFNNTVHYQYRRNDQCLTTKSTRVKSKSSTVIFIEFNLNPMYNYIIPLCMNTLIFRQFIIYILLYPSHMLEKALPPLYNVHNF